MGRLLMAMSVVMVLLCCVGCQGGNIDYGDQTVILYSVPLEVVSTPRFTAATYDDQEFRDFVTAWMAGRLISTGAGGSRKSWEQFPKRHFTLQSGGVTTFVDREQMCFSNHEGFTGVRHVAGGIATVEFTDKDPLEPSEAAHGVCHDVKLTGSFDAALAESMINDAALQLLKEATPPHYSAQTLTGDFTITAERSGVLYSADFQIDLRARAIGWIGGF